MDVEVVEEVLVEVEEEVVEEVELEEEEEEEVVVVVEVEMDEVEEEDVEVEDILDVVEDSRRSRSILKDLNTSFISLIPKQDSTMSPDKFRPISLYNVVYKIISKILASRLKPLLPSLISGEQSGYVEGRKILDDIIQAHEVVHSVTSKIQAGMIMQLDIAKVYDKVNLIYIKMVRSAFGFDHD
eukprot:PITA_22026